MQIDYTAVNEVLTVTARIKAKRIRGINPLQNEFSEMLEHRDCLVDRLKTPELREFVSRLISAEKDEPDYVRELTRLRPILEPRATELQGVCTFKEKERVTITFPMLVLQRNISISMLTYLASEGTDPEKEIEVILEVPSLRGIFYNWLAESATLSEVLDFARRKVRKELGKAELESTEDLSHLRILTDSLIQCRTRLLGGQAA